MNNDSQAEESQNILGERYRPRAELFDNTDQVEEPNWMVTIFRENQSTQSLTRDPEVPLL